MAKTVIIVQARLGSTRFPGKVLADLNGKPVIEHVLTAASACNIGRVVLATTTNPLDDPLAAWFYQWNQPPRRCDIYRGSEHDVLQRFLDVARITEAEVIVRLTGDCPLMSDYIISELIELQAQTGASFVTNDTRISGWLDGFDVEVFNSHVLHRAHRDATGDQREHVTKWILENTSHLVAMRRPAMVGPKLSVDTADDLETVRQWIAARGKQTA